MVHEAHIDPGRADVGELRKLVGDPLGLRDRVEWVLVLEHDLERVGPVAVELATWLVWTPGVALTSTVGTRRVKDVKLTVHTSPVSSWSVPSPPGGTKR